MINDPAYAAQFYKWDRSNYTLAFEMVPGEAGMVVQADMKAHVKQRRKVASGVRSTVPSLFARLSSLSVSSWKRAE
jgi:hypothetical protein